MCTFLCRNYTLMCRIWLITKIGCYHPTYLDTLNGKLDEIKNCNCIIGFSGSVMRPV